MKYIWSIDICETDIIICVHENVEIKLNNWMKCKIAI
jgi:hypothetical protein